MDNKRIGKNDFEALLSIQTEMLQESRRLRLLTAWLIVLTIGLIGTSVATIVATA